MKQKQLTQIVFANHRATLQLLSASFYCRSYHSGKAFWCTLPWPFLLTSPVTALCNTTLH